MPISLEAMRDRYSDDLRDLVHIGAAFAKLLADPWSNILENHLVAASIDDASINTIIEKEPP